MISDIDWNAAVVIVFLSESTSWITGKALCEGMLRYMGSSPKFQPS